MFHKTAAERAILAVEAHASGMSYREIGNALGISQPRAVRLCNKGMKHLQ